MLRGVVVFLFAIAAVNAAIWPEQWGPYARKSLPQPTHKSELDTENGLEAAESADYGTFQVTAARFKDSTGAYAASLERPSLHLGNYVITCSGNCPEDLPKLAETLPRLSRGRLPALNAYFPEKGRIPGSERYILGPLGLKAFAPEIPAGSVGFELGAEGQIAHYRTAKGDQTVAIFHYPTPQMARQQAGELQKLPGAVVKRSGPIVGLLAGSKDPASADRLLSQVNYRASVTLDERPPIVVKPQSVGKMMLAIFALTGIVLAFCVLSGLAFGGFRMLRQRLGPKDAQEPMILLHLSDK